MRMQPQLRNEHIVITRHKLIFDHSREVTVRSIIYPNLQAHSQHFPTNYNSMLFPSNPPWDSYSHFLILFQDFQGTWGAPDSTSWPGLRSFSTTPGAAAERPVVRFFFPVRQRPTLVGVVEPWKMSWLCLEMGTGWYRYTQQLLFKRRNIVIKQRIIIMVPVIKQTRMIPDHSLGNKGQNSLKPPTSLLCKNVSATGYITLSTHCADISKRIQRSWPFRHTPVIACRSFWINNAKYTGCEQLRPCHLSTPLTWKGEWDKPICQTVSLWPWMSK